jgi:hypothetical protein
VWTKEQVLLFADSLENDFPVLSLVLANLKRDSTDLYVLDGQQRILSLIFLRYKVFPTEAGRAMLKEWFMGAPLWNGLRAMFDDTELFEPFDIGLDMKRLKKLLAKVLPSVELTPVKDVDFDTYWAHIKECFRRLNFAGTALSEEELELLLSQN